MSRPARYAVWCRDRGFTPNSQDNLLLWAAECRDAGVPRYELVLAVDAAARPLWGDETDALMAACEALGVWGGGR